MKKFILILLCLLFVSWCSNSNINKNNNKLTVVTTIVPLYSFTKNIVGDKIEVYNLVPPGASVHTWEPKPSDIKIVYKANLLIKNWLGIEEFLEPLLKSTNTNLIQVDTSSWISVFDLMPMIELSWYEESEDDHHEHEWVDPHVWLSPKNAIIQTQNILNEIIKLDPANKEYYENNAKAYIEKLHRLDEEIKAKFANISKKKFILFHDSYQYYLKEYSLVDYRASWIEQFPWKEPSQTYLKSLTDLIKTNKVNILFSDPQFAPKIVEVLHNELWVKVYPLNPLWNSLTEDDYINNVNNITDTFIRAFSE